MNREWLKRIWIVGIIIWAVYEFISLIKSDDWITTISQQLREWFLSLTWSYQLIVVLAYLWFGFHIFLGFGMKVIRKAMLL